MEFIGIWIKDIALSIQKGDWVSATVLFLMALVILIIMKSDIIDKFKGMFAIGKKKKILMSEEYKQFIQSAILRSISKTRVLKDDYGRKIRTLKDSILREQMNYAENALEVINGEQLTVYRATLKEKLKTFKFCKATVDICRMGEDIEEINMDLYKAVLHEIYDVVLAETRRAFKENGLAEKTENEFKNYIEKIVATTMAKSERVARAKIKEQHMILDYDEGFATVDKRRAYEQQKEVFEEARRISVHYYDKIRDLENELSKKLSEVAIEEELNLLLKEKISKEL